MTDIQSSVIVDRPAAEVFDFVADMAQNPRWQKGQISCVWTSPPPLAVGSTYDQEARFAGRTIRSSFEVTEFEPGRRIRIKSTSGPMPIDVTRTVEPLDDNRCEVFAHVQGEPPGVMAKAGGAVDKMVKRNVDADYERLKTILEAEDLPPNHHADYKQFNALFGYVASLTMVLGRQNDADVVAELTPGLGTGMHLVDIGCGPGTAIRTAARAGAKATGVDPSSPMLQMAKLLTRLRPPKGEVAWVESGAESMPFDDGSVDVCWSLKAVHHWPLLEEGVEEVVRVLRPGGLFVSLEKVCEPGASGGSSHGWTMQQAELFAHLLRTDHGFTDVEVATHDSGSTSVVTVTGRSAEV